MTTQAAPRTAYIVPNVAMMDGTSSRMTSRPLITPTTVPMSTAMSTAAATGMPQVTNMAVIEPAMAMIEPMDRSKLPDTISSVTAQPAITVATCCRSTLVMLSMVRNRSDSTVSASMITSSTPTITSL